MMNLFAAYIPAESDSFWPKGFKSSSSPGGMQTHTDPAQSLDETGPSLTQGRDRILHYAAIPRG